MSPAVLVLSFIGEDRPGLVDAYPYHFPPHVIGLEVEWRHLADKFAGYPDPVGAR